MTRPFRAPTSREDRHHSGLGARFGAPRRHRATVHLARLQQPLLVAELPLQPWITVGDPSLARHVLQARSPPNRLERIRGSGVRGPEHHLDGEVLRLRVH